MEGLCIIFRETDISDAGNESGSDDVENTDATIADAGQVTPDLFEVCRPLLGTWNILIESNGEPTCGQNPATQPYVVSLDAQGELQAVWNTTAGADEYEMTSEFMLIDGRCALKNDSVFIIHAPPMNDIPATDIQADYHYTVIADGTNLEGSGIFHTSSTIVTTGEAQQDCTQDIAVSGTISLE